jgi:hypothetical protein
LLLVEGIPVEAGAAHAAGACGSGAEAELFRVLRGGADVGLGGLEEAGEGVGGRLVGPGFAEWGKERVGLGFGGLVEGFLVLLSGGGVEGVEAFEIDLLAVWEGLAEEEVEEFGGPGFFGTDAAIGGGIENFGEAAEGGVVGGAEEFGRVGGDVFGYGDIEFGYFHGAATGGWRALLGEECGGGGGSEEASTFHKELSLFYASTFLSLVCYFGAICYATCDFSLSLFVVPA